MAEVLKKILYLEDDAFISKVANMALRRGAGYEVVHCARGEDAISAFRDFEPDLMLFDVMLPDMDGVTTLQRIREANPGDTTPVIFMTAKAQKHEQQRYIELGAIDVIVKPFSAGTLGKQLEELWTAHRHSVDQNKVA